MSLADEITRLRQKFERYECWWSIEGHTEADVLRDADAGRVYVQFALIDLQHAEWALEDGREDIALQGIASAQAHWIDALELQIPDKNRDRLLVRPNLGGRPADRDDAQRLVAAAAPRPEKTAIARLRAAIEAEEALRDKFGHLSDKRLHTIARENASKD